MSTIEGEQTMATAAAWPMIHAERQALAADLADLTDEQWAAASLCAGWSVREVLAHLLAAAEQTPGGFVVRLAGSGFMFNKMVDKDVAQRTQGPPASTLAAFRTRLNATTHPPGPIEAMVGEAVVHGEDIRRPLGISRTYPAETLIAVADFYKKSNLLLGGKRRVAGLTLRATDIDWSSGTGPEVTGPAASLVIGIAGRRAALDDLAGGGLSTFRTRF
jgi:uncharacterized protein (TIGR03083 family)